MNNNIRNLKERLAWAKLAQARNKTVASSDELATAKGLLSAALEKSRARREAVLDRKLSASQMQAAFQGIDLKRLFS